MEFLECQDFFVSLNNEIPTNVFKMEDENIEIDDELSTVINPDEFLNTEFFKTENETYTSLRSNSESSGSFCENLQLTPPISPQPIIVEGIKLIPVTQIHNGTATKVLFNSERKIKPILPAATVTKSQSGSSDSDSNCNQLNPHLNKAQIKQARLIRNRESALQSRRKKKEYLQNLEVEVGHLRTEVKVLKEENHQLKQKLMTFSNSLTCRCASKISSTKNASLMLALLLIVGFNLFSFIPSISIKSAMLKHDDDVRRPLSSITSRHLLFTAAENNSTVSDENSSENIENDFIPLYFNQTDRIRKANIENVLNWIELFNVTQNNFNGNNNDYENLEDPLQYKLTQMYEKSRSVKNANEKKNLKKPKKRSSKKKSAESNYQENNLYDPDSFKFHEFFDEIKRKDDTFYVFSFKSDHILLPAIENFSQMIKMNLIMPRNNETLSSDKIMMMQIETIVLNTSLIEVAEKSIPSGLVKSSTNSTVMCNQQKMNSGRGGLNLY